MPTLTVYHITPPDKQATPAEDRLKAAFDAVYHITPPDKQATLTVHLGKRGIGYEATTESMPSDSLYAALIAQAAMLEGLPPDSDASPQFARPYLEAAEPPYRFSSLFPRIGHIPLLPRPALALDRLVPDEERRSTIGKGFKKLRYLSPKLFARLCDPNAPDPGDPWVTQGGTVWLSQEEAEAAEIARLLPDNQGTPKAKDLRQALEATRWWRTEQIPRVTVDRVSNASAFYEVGRVVFAAGCGLVLYVQSQPTAPLAALDGLLNLLGDSGLGGRRSSGYGACQFVRQQSDLRLPDPHAPTHTVLLSRFIPQRAEIRALTAPSAAYQLVTVGGWLYSPGFSGQRRQEITLVREGAALVPPNPPQALRGQMVDVRPDYRTSATEHPLYGNGQGTTHPVYRSGIALGVPAHVVQEQPV